MSNSNEKDIRWSYINLLKVLNEMLNHTKKANAEKLDIVNIDIQGIFDGLNISAEEAKMIRIVLNMFFEIYINAPKSPSKTPILKESLNENNLKQVEISKEMLDLLNTTIEYCKIKNRIITYSIPYFEKILDIFIEHPYFFTLNLDDSNAEFKTKITEKFDSLQKINPNFYKIKQLDNKMVVDFGNKQILPDKIVRNEMKELLLNNQKFISFKPTEFVETLTNKYVKTRMFNRYPSSLNINGFIISIKSQVEVNG